MRFPVVWVECVISGGRDNRVIVSRRFFEEVKCNLNATHVSYDNVLVIIIHKRDKVSLLENLIGLWKPIPIFYISQAFQIESLIIRPLNKGGVTKFAQLSYLYSFFILWRFTYLNVCKVCVFFINIVISNLRYKSVRYNEYIYNIKWIQLALNITAYRLTVKLFHCK